MIRVPSATPTRIGEQEKLAVRRAMDAVLNSSAWILGPEVDAFEQEFARYIGAEDVVGVGNGTDALVIALLSLDLDPGSAVLVAETEGGFAGIAARLAGLVPIALDVDPRSFDLTVDILMQAPAASALIVTHLHGNAVRVKELIEWADNAGIAVVEDCAQAHGLRVDGAHVGLAGSVAAFSFYPTKNLGAIGDAGAVVFGRSGDAAVRARALRHYGWDAERVARLPGGRNSRLDPLQAAVLRARLPYLDERNARRLAIRDRYDTALPGRLVGARRETVAHHAVVQLSDRAERDALVAALDAAGVDTAVHYGTLDSEMPAIAAEAPLGSAVASRRRDVIVSLPCSPELEDAEVDRVVSAIDAWRAGHG